MTTISRGRVSRRKLYPGVAVAVVGAAVALASQATAETLDGIYTTVYSSATDTSDATLTSTWGFTQCGPGCARQEVSEGPPREFRLHGKTWTSSYTVDGGSCSTTIDNDTLAGSFRCGPIEYHIQLTRAN